jgi:hypothetical protein
MSEIVEKIAAELEKQKLDLMDIEEVTWGKGVTESEKS